MQNCTEYEAILEYNVNDPLPIHEISISHTHTHTHTHTHALPQIWGPSDVTRVRIDSR